MGIYDGRLLQARFIESRYWLRIGVIIDGVGYKGSYPIFQTLKYSKKLLLALKKIDMKSVEKKEIEKRKINWAIPGQTVTHEEFIEAIREAEKGPFYTLEEMQKMRKECRESK